MSTDTVPSPTGPTDSGGPKSRPNIAIRSGDRSSGKTYHKDDVCARLLLVTNGGGGHLRWRTTEGKSQRWKLERGRGCLVMAGVGHEICWEKPVQFLEIFIDGTYVTTRLRPGDRVHPVETKRLVRLDMLIGPLTKEIIEQTTRSPPAESDGAYLVALCYAYVEKILVVLKAMNERVQRGLSSEVKKRLFSHIAERLDQKIQVSELASVAAMSVPQFIRGFRASEGITPMQYVLRCRVDKALDLLQAGELRVADAAYATGFFDQSHLDRYCRRLYGFTPSAVVRNALRKKTSLKLNKESNAAPEKDGITDDVAWI